MGTAIYFDGANEWYRWPDGTNHRNPGGIATYGWLIEQNGKRIAWGYGEVGRGGSISNNIAEYTALIEAVKAAAALGVQGDLTIYGDSQLVVNQINGHWRINKDHLQELCSKAQTLLNILPNQKYIRWIPREQNEAADELSKAAYKKSLKLTDKWSERFKVNGGPK